MVRRYRRRRRLRRRRTYVRSRSVRRRNKRRFKKSLAQNAIYFKVKKVIDIHGPSETAFRLVLNANGNETPASGETVDAALYTQYGTNSPVAQTLGQIPAVQETWDQNRLAAVKISWFPGMPNGAAYTQSYAAGAVVYDRDGIEKDFNDLTLNQVMEQSNGVKLYNMYRPWKKYIKFPKYRINTRMPSVNLSHMSVSGYLPNQNLAGQWKRVGSSLGQTVSASGNFMERAGHVGLLWATPTVDVLEQDNFHYGQLLITSYFVYKDRL